MQTHTEPLGATPSAPEPTITTILNLLIEDHDQLVQRVATLEAEIKQLRADI